MGYRELLRNMGSRMTYTAQYLEELAAHPELPEKDTESEFLARILQDFEDHATAEDFDKDEEFEKICRLVDELPEAVAADRVNRLQKVTHRVSGRLFDPEASFVGPNRVVQGGNAHVSHRGEQETVRIDGRLYTPIYMAVVDDAVRGDGAAPQYKDFEQTESGQVLIHTGGGGTQNVLWISIGRPLRQVRWTELYDKKDHLNPLIHSFLVPLETANQISRETLTENETAGQSVDINVDKSFEMNQTGIRRPESLERLRREALPGSLRTYYDDTRVKKENVKPYWGDARPLSELKDKLGIPLREMRGFSVFTRETVREKKKKVGFTPKKDYKGMADTLSSLYERYQRGVAEGEIPEDVIQFCRAHHPDLPGPAAMPGGSVSPQSGSVSGVPVSKETLEDFMEHIVAPWATHARIMEAVAEDYEHLLADEHLPEIAPDIRFSPNPSTRGMTGQRRPERSVQAREQAAWMECRSRFLHGAGEAAGILQDDTLLKEAQDNYRFVIGDVAEIRDRLPDFARRLSEVLGTAITSGAYSGVETDRLKELKETADGLTAGALVDVQPEHIQDASGPASTGSQKPPVRQSQLYLNRTRGGGNCFYHALYENLHGVRSDLATQQQMRREIADALSRSPKVIASHFGNDAVAYQRFRREILTEGTWVPDMGPAVIADALNMRLTIYTPGGMLYYDAVPNPSVTGQSSAAGTATLSYDGAHYNSITRERLKEQPEKQSGAPLKEQRESQPQQSPQAQPELTQSGSPETSEPAGGAEKEEEPMQLNPTLGGGNCFFHALYESLHGVRSDLATQQQMREEIVDALSRSPDVIASHFGNDMEAYQRFGEELLTEGTWVPDMGPAIIADALNIRITINRPDGSLYYDAVPNPDVTRQKEPAATATVAYAHDHYRSMTRGALQPEPQMKEEASEKQAESQVKEESPEAQAEPQMKEEPPKEQAESRMKEEPPEEQAESRMKKEPPEEQPESRMKEEPPKEQAEPQMKEKSPEAQAEPQRKEEPPEKQAESRTKEEPSERQPESRSEEEQPEKQTEPQTAENSPQPRTEETSSEKPPQSPGRSLSLDDLTAAAGKKEPSRLSRPIRTQSADLGSLGGNGKIGK